MTEPKTVPSSVALLGGFSLRDCPALVVEKGFSVFLAYLLVRGFDAEKVTPRTDDALDPARALWLELEAGPGSSSSSSGTISMAGILYDGGMIEPFVVSGSTPILSAGLERSAFLTALSSV